MAMWVGSSILVLADRAPTNWGILTIVASFGILFGFGLAAFLALTSLRRGTARRRSR